MPTSHVLNIHLNIILPSMPGSYKWSRSLRCPHQHPVCTFPSPTHATCLTHLILLDLITQIRFSEEYKSLSSSLCKFFPLPCYLIPLWSKYSPQHPILKHPQSMFLPQCEQPSFTPIPSNNQNYSSVYLNLYIFG